MGDPQVSDHACPAADGYAGHAWQRNPYFPEGDLQCAACGVTESEAAQIESARTQVTATEKGN